MTMHIANIIAWFTVRRDRSDPAALWRRIAAAGSNCNARQETEGLMPTAARTASVWGHRRWLPLRRLGAVCTIFIRGATCSKCRDADEHDTRLVRLLRLEFGIARRIERLDKSDLLDGGEPSSDCNDILHGIPPVVMG